MQHLEHVRILRHILSNVAPSIDVIDECVINALKDENPTKIIKKENQTSLFVNKLLNDVGQCILSPVVASYFDGKQEVQKDALFDILTKFRLPSLYSNEFISVCAEEVMLLRYLMNVSPNQWRPAIGQSIKVSLDHLPAFVYNN